MLSSKDIISRLKVQFPLNITLADPFTGEPFTVQRDNLLVLLAIDAGLDIESQINPMLYAEMARLQAAAKQAASAAEARFRQWKAVKTIEARKVLDNGKDSKGNKKPATGDQVIDYYRTHAEYLGEYAKTDNAKAVADLLGDVKTAFELKSRELRNLHGVTFGHNRVANAAENDQQRMGEIEPQMQIEAAQAAEDYRKKRTPRKRKVGRTA